MRLKSDKCFGGSNRGRGQGFSLVELLVALVFTSLLMAGMAGVFQSSLGTFVTSGEKLSSARRNRMSIDMIFDDLNAAGMLLTSLSDYSGSPTRPIILNPLNPAFRITPNVEYADTDVAAPNNVADQLDLYFDEALPFEGEVADASPSVVEYIPDGGNYADGATRSIQLKDDAQAAILEREHKASPVSVLFRANITQPMPPTSLKASGDKKVDVTMSTSLTSADTTTSEVRIPKRTNVLFVRPGRYVRYSIRPRNIDPNPANAGVQVPCLVRDEAIYNAVAGTAAPFAAPVASVIVAENVVGFQVMISPDGGRTWVNDPYNADQQEEKKPEELGVAHTKFKDWSDIRGVLEKHASIKDRPAPNNMISDSRFWFKDIPVTIRVDVTTRTARPRSEYEGGQPSSLIGTTNGGVFYKIQTQSIILVPRHFGLSYNNGLM